MLGPNHWGSVRVTSSTLFHSFFFYSCFVVSTGTTRVCFRGPTKFQGLNIFRDEKLDFVALNWILLP